MGHKQEVKRLGENEAQVLEMQSWTPEERRKALRNFLAEIVTGVLQAARVFAAMEAAGDDVTSIPPGLASYLRRIYSGQVLPEVYVRFEGRCRTKVAALPVPSQQRILDGESIELLIENGDHLKVKPEELQPAQLAQVFGNGHIRSLAEQRTWLEEERMKARHAEVPTEDQSIKVTRGHVEITRPCTLNRQDLIGLLAQLERK